MDKVSYELDSAGGWCAADDCRGHRAEVPVGDRLCAVRAVSAVRDELAKGTCACDLNHIYELQECIKGLTKLWCEDTDAIQTGCFFQASFSRLGQKLSATSSRFLADCGIWLSGRCLYRVLIRIEGEGVNL